MNNTCADCKFCGRGGYCEAIDRKVGYDDPICELFED